MIASISIDENSFIFVVFVMILEFRVFQLDEHCKIVVTFIIPTVTTLDVLYTGHRDVARCELIISFSSTK